MSETTELAGNVVSATAGEIDTRSRRPSVDAPRAGDETGTAVTRRWRWRWPARRSARWRCASRLDFGLPAIYNPDEIAIMSRALAFAKGDLNPHNFLYPTFFFYALFAWIGGYFVLARVTGQVASLNAFQQQFFLDPSSIYLAGRALGAV